MVVTHYGNQQYYGLSSDTKPLAADTAVGAIFEETDTNTRYKNSGTSWLEIPPQSESNFIIYKTGTTYKAKNGSTNAVDYSGSVFSTVINAAIAACPTNETHILTVLPATYDLTAPIGIKNFTNIFGYRQRLWEDTPSGTMFRKDASMTSGAIIESSTPANNLRMPWIRGIAFYGVDQTVDGINAGALWMGRIEDCQFFKCNRAITMAGIANANDDNRIIGNRIHECDKGIEIGALMSACDIISNVIGKCDKDGINALGYSHRIARNKIYENSKQGVGWYGVLLTNANYSQVMYNQIEPDTMQMNGIGITASDYCTISHNRFKSADNGTGRHGIVLLTGSDYNIIDHNLMGYTGQTGSIAIDIRDTCANNELINNKIANFTFPGGKYSATCRIQGNLIDDGEVLSAAADPTTANIPASRYQLWKNSTSGAVKLWYNDAGTMKGVTLT